MRVGLVLAVMIAVAQAAAPAAPALAKKTAAVVLSRSAQYTALHGPQPTHVEPITRYRLREKKRGTTAERANNCHSLCASPFDANEST